MDPRVEKHLTKLMIDRCGDIRHEFRWANELELLSVVRHGRTDLIAPTLEKSREKYDQTMEDIDFSGRKDRSGVIQFISAVTLFCRAAIEGGVPENLAFSMLESYIYIATNHKCDLFMDALYSYTGAVADFKINDGAEMPQIKAVKSYVMENLNNPISLESIGELLHLSPSRCAHLFKDKTGMTIHQYVERERVKAACAFLAYTDMSVSALSEYLVFSSPSHFASVFRRHKGLSPKEWKRRTRSGELVR